MLILLISYILLICFISLIFLILLILLTFFILFISTIISFSSYSSLPTGCWLHSSCPFPSSFSLYIFNSISCSFYILIILQVLLTFLNAFLSHYSFFSLIQILHTAHFPFFSYFRQLFKFLYLADFPFCFSPKWDFEIATGSIKTKSKNRRDIMLNNITGTDFADDIALISNSLENVQSLLLSVEQTSNCVSRYLNNSKTVPCNRNYSIKTLNKTSLKQIDDYTYLG